MQQFGLEMEMVVADAITGRAHPVRAYFARRAQQWRELGVAPTCLADGSGRPYAVSVPHVDCGLDNAYHHLESALAPQWDLAMLDAAARNELAAVLDALAAEGATLLNVAQHPDCPRDAGFYASVCAPRPIYHYWRHYRGWHHAAGIDAKAQNGPTLSVPVERAARALNVLLALAPASIALSANSPLESGCLTGLQENRLTIWPRMFGCGHYAGDRHLSQLPSQPFADLGDYFRWAFGPGTVMQAIKLDGSGSYKGDVALGVPLGDPSLLEFLAAAQWPVRSFPGGERIDVRPSVAHVVSLQYSPFLDVRYRYQLAQLPDVGALRTALGRPGGVEALWTECGATGYLECRMSGASFPDAGLVAECGVATAATQLLGPLALQWGLLNNLDAAEQLVRDWGWQRLRGLRMQAIRHALADPEVTALAGEVLDVARAGLPPSQRARLAALAWTHAARRPPATRLREVWQSGGSDPAARLAAVARHSAVLHPRYWSAPAPAAAPATAPAQ